MNTRRSMRKILFLSALWVLCLFAPALANAEISTNLSIVSEYNAQGDVVRETFVDENGQPVMADDKAYCYAEHRYNSFPRVIETTFHDVKGKQVTTAQGYAAIRYKWSGLGAFIQKQYVDRKGKPVMGEDGYATHRYDYQGERVKQMGYYDTEGNPVRARQLRLRRQYHRSEKGVYHQAGILR